MTILANAANGLSLYEKAGKGHWGINAPGAEVQGGAGGLSDILEADTASNNSITMQFGVINGAGTNATTPGAGSVIRMMWRGAFTNFSLLNTSAQIMGFSSAATVFDDTTTTARISFGAKSTGVVHLIAANGSAVTSQSTGITITAGVFYDFELVWIVSNSLILYIDGVGTTVLTDLPTTITRSLIGFGTTGVATAKTFEFANFSISEMMA